MRRCEPRFERVCLRRLRENVLPSGVHVPLHEPAVSGPDEADQLIAARVAEMFDLDYLPLTVDLYWLPGAEHLPLINVNLQLSSATAALYAATSPATKVHGNLSRVYRIQPGG